MPLLLLLRFVRRCFAFDPVGRQLYAVEVPHTVCVQTRKSVDRINHFVIGCSRVAIKAFAHNVCSDGVDARIDGVSGGVVRGAFALAVRAVQ